jgi:dsRNA-specific ribonuclease
LEEHFVCGDAH